MMLALFPLLKLRMFEDPLTSAIGTETVPIFEILIGGSAEELMIFSMFQSLELGVVLIECLLLGLEARIQCFLNAFYRRFNIIRICS